MSHSMQESSSLTTRDQTHGPCYGSTESQPLDGQACPQILLITSMDTSLGPKALDEGILIFLPDFFFLTS